MDLEKLKSLTDIELNTEVAKLLGYINIHTEYVFDTDNFAKPAQTRLVGARSSRHAEDGSHDKIPDYVNRLDAIHKVVSKVFCGKPGKWKVYCDCLSNLTIDTEGGAFEAMAKQRVIAFLYTEGKAYEIND